MKAKKITMKVVVEVFSLDSIPALIHEVANEIQRETTAGKINKDDGDSIKWNYKESRIKL